MGVRIPLSPQAVRHLLDFGKISGRLELSSDQTEEIRQYGAIVGSTVHHYEYLDRGMDKARRVIDDYEKRGESFPSGMVIVADSMNKSVGRFGREWHAPSGGIWLALIMVNTLVPRISRLYPLAAGVACCEFVRDYDLDARLKWVNDVLLEGKKVAGILTETHFGENSKEEYIIIGLGVNVNNRHFPVELRNEACSLRTELGRELDFTQAVQTLLARLAWNMGLLCLDEKNLLASDENGPPELLVPARWRQLSDSAGRRVKFGFNVREAPQYEATVLGLDESGGLNLLLADGSSITEYGGEIIYTDFP